jgi:hypothetical protein
MTDLIDEYLKTAISKPYIDPKGVVFTHQDLKVDLSVHKISLTDRLLAMALMMAIVPTTLFIYLTQVII